jgi:RNA polymerase sigma-70 factor (ECF subfamily)
MISEKDILIIKNKLRRYIKNDNFLIEELTSTCLVKIDKYQYYNNSEDKYYNALLKTVAKSVFISYERKKKTKKGRLLVLNEMDSISSYNADDIVIKKENEKIVLEILDFLSKNQKEVVLMRFYLDLTFREISEILNCSINTVLGIMTHAKTKIQKHFKEA